MPKSEYIEYFYFETLTKMLALGMFKEKYEVLINEHLTNFPVSAVDDELQEADKVTYYINSIVAINEVCRQTAKSGVLSNAGKKYVRQILDEAHKLWDENNFDSMDWVDEEIECAGIDFESIVKE